MTANPEIVDMMVKIVNEHGPNFIRRLRDTSEALVRREPPLPLAQRNFVRAATDAAVWATFYYGKFYGASPTFETILAAAAQLADHWYEEAKAQLEDPSPEVLTKGETV